MRERAMLASLTHLVLAAASRVFDPSSVFVIYEPDLPLHAATLQLFEDADPGTVVRINNQERTPHVGRPRVVVALGASAERRAEAHWPDTPRFSLFTFSEASDAAPSDKPRHTTMRVPPRPATTCSVQALTRLYGQVSWIVVAAPSDLDAPAFAQALGARLIQADPAAARRRLLDGLGAGERYVWLRAAPEFAILPWLEELGRLAALPGVTIAGDTPGLRRYGIEVPIALDLRRLVPRVLALASAARSAERVRARGNPGTLEIPCGPSSPADHGEPG